MRNKNSLRKLILLEKSFIVYSKLKQSTVKKLEFTITLIINKIGITKQDQHSLLFTYHKIKLKGWQD